VTIDEVVLHGFEPSQRYAISGAIEHELIRILSTNQLDFKSCNVANVKANNAAFNMSWKPNRIGVGIAHAVYGGLKNVQQNG
jgi:hypothetical protein